MAGKVHGSSCTHSLLGQRFTQCLLVLEFSPLPSLHLSPPLPLSSLLCSCSLSLSNIADSMRDVTVVLSADTENETGR